MTISKTTEGDLLVTGITGTIDEIEELAVSLESYTDPITLFTDRPEPLSILLSAYDVQVRDTTTKETYPPIDRRGCIITYLENMQPFTHEVLKEYLYSDDLRLINGGIIYDTRKHGYTGKSSSGGRRINI